MLAEQRRALILAEINRTGGVRIADLPVSLGVSGVTARRDVEALADRGLVARVRGGALALIPGGVPGPAGRQRAKLAIARSAAVLVRPAEAIGILAGATTTLLARELLEIPGLTVVTNAIGVADAFHHEGRTDQTVVLIGGVRTRAGALVGPVAEHAAAGLNLDVLFLGAYGMTPRTGFTTPDAAEARFSATLIAAARRVVVLADHGKWGVTGAALIAPLDGADILVTDAGLNPAARATLRRRVGHLIIADPAFRRLSD